jgi:hypothetical protein
VDRCALFVDAGYVLGDGAMAVHGTRNRESVSWDYAAVLQVLGNVARDRTGLPLLRCYWYEATVEGRRSPEHETLADLPGVKLRLGRMRPGRREGVESEIHRDLTTLARNRAISDALVVSAEEDLAQVISDVQDLGIRVILAYIPVNGTWSAPSALRQECDDVVEIGEAHLRSAVELIVGAEPVTEEERYTVGAYAGRAPSNGHGPTGALAHRQALPVGSHAASPAIYTGPLIADYQRAAQPALSQPAAASSSGPSGLAISPAAGPQAPAVPGADSRPGPVAPPAPQPQAPLTAQPGPGQPGAAVPPGSLQPGLPVRSAGPAQPGMPGQGMPNGMPGQSAPPGLASQPGPPAQPGLATPPGMLGQPGLPPASSVPSVGHAPGSMPVLPGAPGLPSQPAPRAGGQHAGRALPETSLPAGPLPVVHGQHELTPQQPVPPGPPAMTQPYQYQAAPPAPAPAGSRPPGAPLGQGQPAPAGQAPGPAIQPGQHLRGAPRSFQPPAGHPDGGAPGPYVPQQGPNSGPQPAAQQGAVAPVAVSLADAVQAAHTEGFNFGQVVARDAPALWLEAVLARKPRMPSDLEARLLQDSSLPIDSLLHDEVRHALRRGFWDALERVRH